MPRDGQGQYIPPLSNWNPAVDGNEADPDGWNQLRNDMVSALSQSVSSDGQTMMTGPLNMGGQGINSLSAPTGNGQALRRDQLIKGTNIASASTINIPNEGSVFEITGTTDIENITGGYDGRLVTVYFQDELTIKNSVNLNLPNSLDITTKAGDAFVFYRTSSSVWRSLYGYTALIGTGTAPDQIPTNDDLGDAAYANVVGTMAAGDIIESGSNTNGGFVRFADGTQICTCLRDMGSGPISTQIGSLFVGFETTVSFASAFIAPPKISLTSWAYVAQIQDVYNYSAFVLGTPTTSSYFPVVVSARTASNASRIIFETATGRWKA